MIRNAKFADIHGITRFLLWCHSQSHYAGTSVGVDLDETKRLVGSGIGRHGHKNGGGCWVQVVDNDGNIDGLMFATLVRVYSIGDKLMASDLFWVCNEHAAPGDALILMRNMIAWARSSPYCVEVHIATSAVIQQDPKVVSRLLKTMGMKEYGYIHRLELDTITPKAVAEKEEALT
jgi:hypothetical protein